MKERPIRANVEWRSCDAEFFHNLAATRSTAISERLLSFPFKLFSFVLWCIAVKQFLCVYTEESLIVNKNVYEFSLFYMLNTFWFDIHFWESLRATIRRWLLQGLSPFLLI